MKILNPTTFQTIVKFVLREGDLQTYCNMYNNNPHLAHAGFDVYLNPDVGQEIDPELSRFDTIVFRAEDYARVKLSGEKLEFDAADRDALEYYFAALIAYISSRD